MESSGPGSAACSGCWTVVRLSGERVGGAVLVVAVLGIIGLFPLGGRPPVVAVVLHLLPVGVAAGQTAARHLVVIVGEGVIGDLADYAAADGRSFAADACAAFAVTSASPEMMM